MLVVGSSAAGLRAAREANRAGAEVLLLGSEAGRHEAGGEAPPPSPGSFPGREALQASWIARGRGLVDPLLVGALAEEAGRAWEALRGGVGQDEALAEGGLRTLGGARWLSFQGGGSRGISAEVLLAPAGEGSERRLSIRTSCLVLAEGARSPLGQSALAAAVRAGAEAANPDLPAAAGLRVVTPLAETGVAGLYAAGAPAAGVRPADASAFERALEEWVYGGRAGRFAAQRPRHRRGTPMRGPQAAGRLGSPTRLRVGDPQRLPREGRPLPPPWPSAWSDRLASGEKEGGEGREELGLKEAQGRLCSLEPLSEEEPETALAGIERLRRELEERFRPEAGQFGLALRLLDSLFWLELGAMARRLRRARVGEDPWAASVLLRLEEGEVRAEVRPLG